jgi:hypothetical protein
MNFSNAHRSVISSGESSPAHSDVGKNKLSSRASIPTVSPQIGSFTERNASGLSVIDLSKAMLRLELHHSMHTKGRSAHNQAKECEVPQLSASAPDKKSVKFGGLVIREHKLTISDLPWRDGPPVTLSWEQVSLTHLDLEEFEERREGERRGQKDLRTTGADRRAMLKEQGGYSDSDLIRAEELKKAFSLSRSQPKSLSRRRNLQN